MFFVNVDNSITFRVVAIWNGAPIALGRFRAKLARSSTVATYTPSNIRDPWGGLL